MISSRDMGDLVEPAKTHLQALLNAWSLAGYTILVTSTYRDSEAQDALYARGRSTPGPIVTDARGGESFHQYRCAMDVVPLINGKCDWTGSDPIWRQMIDIAHVQGITCGADWATFHELCHFQWTGGLTLDDLKAGKTIV